MGANILVLVVAATPHAAGTIPRKWWPIILLGVVVPVSLVYWAVLWSIQNEWFGSELFGVSVNVHHPDPTLGKSTGRQQSDFEKMMIEARVESEDGVLCSWEDLGKTGDGSEVFDGELL